VRRFERSSSSDPKLSAEGGQEVLQTPEQRFPPDARAEVPLQP